MSPVLSMARYVGVSVSVCDVCPLLQSAISSIKARLNTSGTELIYSTVAEILA